jgi:hypothetical protein
MTLLPRHAPSWWGQSVTHPLGIPHTVLSASSTVGIRDRERLFAPASSSFFSSSCDSDLQTSNSRVSCVTRNARGRRSDRVLESMRRLAITSPRLDARLLGPGLHTVSSTADTFGDLCSRTAAPHLQELKLRRQDANACRKSCHVKSLISAISSAV